MKDGKIKSLGFKTIYTLAKDVSPDSSKTHTENTALVLRSIAMNTSFLGEHFNHKNTKNFEDNENAMFLGALFLRLSKISQLNCHQVSVSNIFQYISPSRLNGLMRIVRSTDVERQLRVSKRPGQALLLAERVLLQGRLHSPGHEFAQPQLRSERQAGLQQRS